MEPLTEAPHEDGHITGVFCMNAVGFSIKPMFILKNLVFLPPELKQFIDEASLSTQASGWMTRRLFFNWCVNFVHELSAYRLTLPPMLRNARATLVTDGHTSRMDVLACQYLHDNYVDMVVLPAHT